MLSKQSDRIKWFVKVKGVKKRRRKASLKGGISIEEKTPIIYTSLFMHSKWETLLINTNKKKCLICLMFRPRIYKKKTICFQYLVIRREIETKGVVLNGKYFFFVENGNCCTVFFLYDFYK